MDIFAGERGLIITVPFSAICQPLRTLFHVPYTQAQMIDSTLQIRILLVDVVDAMSYNS